MRPTIALLTALFVLTPAIPAAPMDQPSEWFTWSDDGEEVAPRPAGGDIEAVQIGFTRLDLHLKLETFDATLPALAASSEARFAIEQQQSRQVHFTWGDQPRLEIDGEEADGWQVSDEAGPHAWHLKISWTTLRVDAADAFFLKDLDAAARSAMLADDATGPDLYIIPTLEGVPQVHVLSLAQGATIEGPDFAGGTSVTVNHRGEPLLAYYIYDDSRRTPRGIYMAHVDAERATLVPERIAATSLTREHGRDAQMRTQIAFDGTDPFILYTDDPAVDNDEDGPGHPGTPDSVYVLARQGTKWVKEDPTPEGTSDVGPEDVADLAARDGLVVAAVPVGQGVWVVERNGADSWDLVTRLDGANNAKIAIDSQGNIHVAYVVYGPDGNMRDGTLFYASSSNGFEPTHIGDNIGAGWEEPETDGSFAIAIGDDDQVALLWNDGRGSDPGGEQRVAILDQGGWSYDYAPLTPTHGNPQYTMRLGYAKGGNLVAASGYGGTDSLAARTPTGSWSARELPRYDVWDMAVAPSGLVYFGYTQPHGGTTLALSAYGVDVTGPDGVGELATFGVARDTPGLGVMAALVALMAVGLRLRRS